MILIGVLTMILAIALSSLRITAINFNRIAIILLLYSGVLAHNALCTGPVGSGVGVFGGLFQVTTITQSMDIFIYLVGALVLLLGESSGGTKGGSAPLLAEYPLIVLFTVLGMSSLISSSDLVSMYLSIELQSFAVYILATIYRESESATSAGLKYFLLGSLSSALILLGSSLLYGFTGLTSFEGLYMLCSTPGGPHFGIELSVLLMAIGLLFKVAAAPFHNWAPDVYDGVPTLVTSWLAIMPKISFLVFILEFQGFAQLGTNWPSWTYLLLISSLLSLIIGTIGGLAQYRIKRLLAYSTIVRHCALPYLGNSISGHCPYMLTATKLGRGVSLRLNIASSFKGEIRSKQSDRLALRAVSSMVKAGLLEVYLLGASTIGRQHVCNRLTETNPIWKWWIGLWTVFNRAEIHSLNVEKGQPKEDVGLDMGTMGLPKAGNSYGSRRIVVPVKPFMVLCCPTKLGTKGRVLGDNLRSFTSAAGDSSTVKSDATCRLLKLAVHCKRHDVIEEPIYRLMYDTRLYEMAYNKLKSKPGNMTPGINPTTLDVMSSEVINEIIQKLKDDSFQFTPGRRVQIPKSNEDLCSFTVAPPRDKLVQEVMRMILEVIFEPTFSDSSHGFRTGKSCHTALREIKGKFGVASWYIEGDISKCFDSINHNKLMEIIEAKIKDRRFTRLIRKALKAGYFEFRVYRHSIIGTPQGSIISPILCNIFMDLLDKFVEKLKIEFDTGKSARANPEWVKYQNRKARTKDLSIKMLCHRKILTIPSKDPMDPNFKRLVYVRYADDWIIGIRGSFEDSRIILDRIDKFLKYELGLNLSSEKTLITNAKTGRAEFLGTRFGRAQHRTFSRRLGFSKRNSLEIRLEAPLDRISRKLVEASFMKGKEPIPKFLWIANDKDEIITLYNAVIRGFVNYYSFVMNYNQMVSWIHFVLKTSCAKLLAAKYSLKTQSKVYKKFGKDLKGNDKIGFTRAEFGIKPWDFKSSNIDIIKALYTKSISAASLNNLKCSMCDSTYRVEMHHVRHLKDLNPKARTLDALMAKKRKVK